MRLYTAVVDLMNDREYEDLEAIKEARRWLEATADSRSISRNHFAVVRPIARVLCSVAALVGTPHMQHEATIFAEAICEERCEFMDLFDEMLEAATASKAAFHQLVKKKLQRANYQVPDSTSVPLGRMSAEMRAENRARSVSASAARRPSETHDAITKAMRAELEEFKRHVNDKTESGMKAALNSLEGCSQANEALRQLAVNFRTLSEEQKQTAAALERDLQRAVDMHLKSKDNTRIEITELRQLCADLQTSIMTAEHSRRDGDDIQAHDLNLLGEDLESVKNDVRKLTEDQSRTKEAIAAAVDTVKDELRSEMRELMRRHEKSLATLQATHDKRFSDLTAHIKRLEEQLARRDDVHAATVADLARLNERVARLARDVETFQDSVNEWSETASKFATVQAVDARIAAATAAGTTQREVPDFSDYALTKQLDALANTVKRDLDALRKVSADVLAVARRCDGLANNDSRLSNNVDALQADLSEVKADVERVRVQCDGLAHTSTTTESQYGATEVDRIRASTKQTKDAVIKLRHDLELVLEQTSAHPQRGQVDRLQRTLTSLQNRIEDVAGSLSQFKEVVGNDIRGLCNRLETEVKQLRSEIDDAIADDDTSIDDHVEALSPPPRAPDGATAAQHGDPAATAVPESVGGSQPAATNDLGRILTALVERAEAANVRNQPERNYATHPPREEAEYKAALEKIDAIEQAACVGNLEQACTTRHMRHMDDKALFSFWATRFAANGVILSDFPIVVERISHFEPRRPKDSDNWREQWGKMLEQRRFLVDMLAHELTKTYPDMSKTRGVIETEFALAFNSQRPYQGGLSYEAVKRNVLAKLPEPPGNAGGRGSGTGGRARGRRWNRGGYNHHQPQNQQQQPAQQNPPHQQQQQQQSAAAPQQPQQGSAPSGLRSSGTTPFRPSSNP